MAYHVEGKVFTMSIYTGPCSVKLQHIKTSNIISEDVPSTAEAKTVTNFTPCTQRQNAPD